MGDGTLQTALGTSATNTWSKIQAAVGTPIGTALAWGKDLLTSLGTGMGDGTLQTALGTSATNTWSKIQSAVGTPINNALSWGANLLTHLGIGLGDGTLQGTLNTNAGNIWSKIQTSIGDPFAGAANWSNILLANLGIGIADPTQMSILFTNAGKVWDVFRDNIGKPMASPTDGVKWGGGFLTRLTSQIQEPEPLQKLKDGAGKVLDKFKEGLGWTGTVFQSFIDLGKNIIDGLSNGMKTKLDELMAAGGNLFNMFNDLLKWISKFFGGGSPSGSSNTANRAGQNLVNGLALGINQNMPNAIRAAQELTKGVMAATNELSISAPVSLTAQSLLPNLGYSSTSNMTRPNMTTNNMTYNLSYQTMRSAESVQQDIELLNLLYGGGQPA